MITTSPLDFRSTEGRAARNYIRNSSDMFALYFKAGVKSIVGLVPAETLYNVLRNDKETRVSFSDEKDGLRWKALQIVHCPVALRRVMDKVTISIAMKDFPRGTNGTRSEAQEKALCEALNTIKYHSLEWRWTANDNNSKYCADLTGYDAEGKARETIEVKGERGRIV